jgi:aryl-alcohol dehydrogenase-like predicted oxidoreductase
MTLFSRFTRYEGAEGKAAIQRYAALAREVGLDPAQMALAYIDRKAFVTATIIGATTMAQLKSNIDAFDLSLDAAVVAGIDAIHRECPNPCP